MSLRSLLTVVAAAAAVAVTGCTPAPPPAPSSTAPATTGEPAEAAAGEPPADPAAAEAADPAAAPARRALDVYFTSSTPYVDPGNPGNTARSYTLRAAADLYGSCGAEYPVQRAWTAVNVAGSDAACA
ncbi:hypothetical protein AB0H83_12740 [Dactylosporangium sp. NPDC050688]|uniref:hypothetical protein n=1 Tax=Dactylosporangium sp. NPDC050688 TaxID=3157217 RepID=UPI0033FF6A16